MTLRVLLLMTLSLLSITACSEKGPYQSSADPEADFQQALAKAGGDQKRVLIVFGANWCPDCRSLDEKFQQLPLAATLEQNFHVVRVDVGNFDRNLEFARKFGNPIGVGIPSLAIVGADKRVFYVAEAGQFASSRSTKTETLDDWFKKMLKQIENRNDAKS